MGIRLFVTDMDGTLIGRSYSIEPGPAACIRSLQSAGVAFAVATGRIRRDAAAICSRVGLSPYVISNNGTCLFSPTGELLHGRPVPPDVLVDAIGFLEDEAICYGLGASEAFVSPSSWRALLNDEVGRLARQGIHVPPDRIEHASSENAEQDGFTCVESPLDLVTSEAMAVYSISVVSFDFHVADLVRRWARRFPGIAVSVSGTHNVEIMDVLGTKAHSLAALCDRIGVPLADVAAVGDSLNDLEMVREAGLGIAMGNAMSELKAAADVVVAPQAEGGFQQAVALALATR